MTILMQKDPAFARLGHERPSSVEAGLLQQGISVSCDETESAEEAAVEVSIVVEEESESSTELVAAQDSKGIHAPSSWDLPDNKQVPAAEADASPAASSDPPPAQRQDETSLDGRATSILSEARSALSGMTINVPKLETDERTRQIIQEALHSKSRPTKLRSTREVLQLAGQVLETHRSLSLPDDTEVRTNPSDEMPESAKKDIFADLRQKALFVRSPVPPEQQTDDSISINPEDLKKHSDLTIEEETEEKHASFVDRDSSKYDKYDRPGQFSFMNFLRREVRAAAACGGQSAEPSPKAIYTTFAPWACGATGPSSDVVAEPSMIDYPESFQTHRSPVGPPASQATSEDPFFDTFLPTDADSRMPLWVSEQKVAQEEAFLRPRPEEDFYTLEKSRTVVVHEIARGNWTWCTAWAPDGNRLAVATENHHLAVVETKSSTVWRVQYDRRMPKPLKSNTTHSIRSIAWGRQFIAIGGTGNAVSILAPIEPYPILHAITGTDFVSSLSWRADSSILAIASRDDRCIVVDVNASDDGAGRPPGTGRHIRSKVIASLSQKDWVNAVAFSPSGNELAVGDRTGKLSVYSFEMTPFTEATISDLDEVMMKDSILSVEWSSDGRWLYAGGEDYSITIIDTRSYKKIHKVPRDKWVQFIASSNRGTHVAVGGVASEVTILDVKNKWEPAMNIELKGLVPLSAKWHPQDRYLVLTGQTNSVVAVETTNARHIGEHCLHSISPILSIAFSPDGRMIIVGNESGVISIFGLSGGTFVTSYELVVSLGQSLTIDWSPNGAFVVIGNGDSIVIVGRAETIAVGSTSPPKSSGFCVKKVIRGLKNIRTVSVDNQSRFVAVSGDTTRILDAADDFTCVREWKRGYILANSWSPDGTWLASIGKTDNLTLYETSSDRLGQWRVVFAIQAAGVGNALAWAPSHVGGLQYLAYGGDSKKVTVVEIRTQEESWEKVIEIPRNGVIQDLDWNENGLLAVALGDGTVSLVDLSYLQSGRAVNEMDYNWQRQGITCFTEIRRNKGKNSMRTARWMPFRGRDYSLLAVGGTDGELEILDLTERQRCRGFSST
jgi:WD40 repeat protein/transcriptional regulator of met regulon